MNPLSLQGTHRVVTLRVPGRVPTRLLCMMQKDETDADAYYVLAENGGRALKWRNMVQGNAARRLRNEFKRYIVDEAEVDAFDVEMIFFCTTEVSNV